MNKGKRHSASRGYAIKCSSDSVPNQSFWQKLISPNIHKGWSGCFPAIIFLANSRLSGTTVTVAVILLLVFHGHSAAQWQVHVICLVYPFKQSHLKHPHRYQNEEKCLMFLYSWNCLQRSDRFKGEVLLSESNSRSDNSRYLIVMRLLLFLHKFLFP